MPEKIPAFLEFDADNIGRSFRSGFGLLNELGRSAGIHIEFGKEYDSNRQRYLARRIVASFNACADLSIEQIEKLNLKGCE